jgi:hypothetical protein
MPIFCPVFLAAALVPLLLLLLLLPEYCSVCPLKLCCDYCVFALSATTLLLRRL